MKPRTSPAKPTVAEARAKLLLVTRRIPYNHNQQLARAFIAGLQAGSSGKQHRTISPALLELISKVCRWL